MEILLADWIPRKIVADPAYLSKAPELLRSFIRYCHDRWIRTALTDETLAAVDQWEPEYQRLIRSSRPQGAAAIAAAVQLAAADLATMTTMLGTMLGTRRPCWSRSTRRSAAGLR